MKWRIGYYPDTKMAITSETNRTAELVTDGVETDFDFSMLVHAKSEIEVYYQPDDGRYNLLALDTNYGVVFTDDGGTVSTDGYSAPLAAGKLLIIRHLELTQQTNWLYNDAHTEQTHQDDFDRSCIRDIQQQEELDRCPKFLTHSAIKDITFPEPAADMVLGWNAGGTDLANISPSALAVLIAEDIIAGEVPEYLTDLTDVTITAPVSGDLLRYDGSMWLNDPYTNIDHDQLTNFVAAKHIDWTNATDDFLTTGTLGAGVITGTSLIAGTLTLTNGSITDSGGTISFGNENLLTTGTITSGNITSAGDIAGTGLITSGVLTADAINEYTGATGVTIEGVLLKDNNITTTGTGEFGTGGVGLFDAAGNRHLYLKVANAILDEDMYLTFNVDDNYIITLKGSPTLDGQDYRTTGSPTFANPTVTSLIIGGNTLDTNEWSVLDGVTSNQVIDWTGASAGTIDATNIEDKFLRNDAADSTSGVLTAAGFTTAGTVQAEHLKSTDDIEVADQIFHSGDTDTYIEFGTDGILLYAGGKAFLTLNEGSPTWIDVNQTMGVTNNPDLLTFLASGAGIVVDGTVRATGATIDTSGEINFRDTDISMGSTLTDGILDMSADGSIRMFYDNADVGDAVDGQIFYVYRRAEEADNYIKLFTDQHKQAKIDTDGITLDLHRQGTLKLRIQSTYTRNYNDFDVTGVYKVDNTQVVGNRVIDARCDDAVNSGDATTDGVIDALRDAMITHGLIAAA